MSASGHAMSLPDHALQGSLKILQEGWQLNYHATVPESANLSCHGDYWGVGHKKFNRYPPSAGPSSQGAKETAWRVDNKEGKAG